MDISGLKSEDNEPRGDYEDYRSRSLLRSKNDSRKKFIGGKSEAYGLRSSLSQKQRVFMKKHGLGLKHGVEARQ